MSATPVTFKEIVRRLPLSWRAGRNFTTGKPKYGLPAMIWGPPGVGKSAAIFVLSKLGSYTVPENPEMAGIDPELDAVYGKSFTGRPLKDIRLAMCTPTSLMGVPVFDAEYHTAYWVMTDLLPMDPRELHRIEVEFRHLKCSSRELDNKDMDRIAFLRDRIIRGLHEQHSILFMDEIVQAPGSIQAAALQITLDRKSGTYTLPDGVDIAAAGNRKSDRAGVNSMLTPLSSRFNHFHFDIPSSEEFTEFMTESSWSPELISYHKFRPEAVFDFSPDTLIGNAETAESTFPCPRTWEFVNDMLMSIGPDDGKEVYEDTLAQFEGLVGSGAAAEFIAFLRSFMNLPDVMLVLEGKTTAKEMQKHYVSEGGHYDPSLEFAYIHKMIDVVFKEASKHVTIPISEITADQLRDLGDAIRWCENLNKYLLSDSDKIEWAAVFFQRVVAQRLYLIWKETPSHKEVINMANFMDVIGNRRQ